MPKKSPGRWKHLDAMIGNTCPQGTKNASESSMPLVENTPLSESRQTVNRRLLQIDQVHVSQSDTELLDSNGLGGTGDGSLHWRMSSLQMKAVNPKSGCSAITWREPQRWLRPCSRRWRLLNGPEYKKTQLDCYRLDILETQCLPYSKCWK